LTLFIVIKVKCAKRVVKIARKHESGKKILL